jgi:hypothetical protein
MKELKLIAVDYAQGFPVIENPGNFIRKEIEEGLLKDIAQGFGYTTILVESSDADEIKGLMQKHHGRNSAILTRDHMMSYFGLLSAQYDPASFCLIILDQHLDIYSYQTHSGRLNKANSLRFSHDNGLVNRFFIVGVRDSEESEFDDFHRMFIPDYASFTQDRKYAGMDGIVTVVPMRKIEDLGRTLMDIIDQIQLEGYRTVGIDIDLDCFDSTRIKGVQFNETFPDLVRERIGDLTADFISGQLQERGLPDESIGEAISGTCRYIKEKGLELVYRGITEFEPESDGNGLTRETVGTILRAFDNNL